MKIRSKALVAAFAAAALTIGGATSAAFADEAPAVDAAVTPQETSAPVDTPEEPVEPQDEAPVAAEVVPEPEVVEPEVATEPEVVVVEEAVVEAPAVEVTELAVAPEVTSTVTPPPADTTPYIILGWRLPGDASEPHFPGQILAAHDYLAVADLNALDARLVGTCGIDYQVDLENDSQTTRDLIVGGVLNGPGNPAEDHAYGAPGLVGNPWKIIDNADCVVTPPVDTPPVVTPPVVEPPVVVPPVVEPPVIETAAVVVAPKPVKVAPVATELAATGGATDAWPGLLAAMLVILGGAFFVTDRVLRTIRQH